MQLEFRQFTRNSISKLEENLTFPKKKTEILKTIVTVLTSVRNSVQVEQNRETIEENRTIKPDKVRYFLAE